MKAAVLMVLGMMFTLSAIADGGKLDCQLVATTMEDGKELVLVLDKQVIDLTPDQYGNSLLGSFEFSSSELKVDAAINFDHNQIGKAIRAFIFARTSARTRGYLAVADYDLPVRRLNIETNVSDYRYGRIKLTCVATK